MQLTCQVCNAPMTSESLDLEGGIARCAYCGAMFDLGGRKAQALGVKDVERRARPRVPMPSRFRVEEEPGLLRISWSWFTPATVFLTFFCIAWDSFLVFWYGMALAGKNTPWLMVVFPIAHVAVGVGLTYRVIAGYVNRTVVEVSRRELSIKHGPLPWLGSRAYPAAELRQLYCEQQLNRGKNGATTVYQLNAIDQYGAKKTLLSSLEEAAQALYLEEQLERRLGIDDEPVAGELDKGRARA